MIMGMDKHIYIGPYVRCKDNKTGNPDHWVTEEFDGERLCSGNGESIDAPALFIANVAYEGQIEALTEFSDSYWTGEASFDLDTAPATKAFEAAFAAEIKILRDWFASVEIVFGVIATYS